MLRRNVLYNIMLIRKVIYTVQQLKFTPKLKSQTHERIRDTNGNGNKPTLGFNFSIYVSNLRNLTFAYSRVHSHAPTFQRQTRTVGA